MITPDRAVQALRDANPIVDERALPQEIWSDDHLLNAIVERIGTMQTRERRVDFEEGHRHRQPRWLVPAIAGALVVIGAVVIAIVLSGGGGGDVVTTTTTPPTTTTVPTTTTTPPQTTTTAGAVPADPLDRLDAFFSALAGGEVSAATNLTTTADAELLAATGWVEGSGECSLEDGGDSNEQLYTCLVPIGSATAARVGEATLRVDVLYMPSTSTFTNLSFSGDRFLRELQLHALLYDRDAYAAACVADDFNVDPFSSGRTAACGAYLASIDAAAAQLRDPVEELSPGVARVNDVTDDGGGTVLQVGRNQFDRFVAPFALTIGDGASVLVQRATAGSVLLDLSALASEGAPHLELIAPILYADPQRALSPDTVSAPVPVFVFGGFAGWLDSIGPVEVVDEGVVTTATGDVPYLDLVWAEEAALMAVVDRAGGVMRVSAGEATRVYVVEHPNELPLLWWVTDAGGSPAAAGPVVEALLENADFYSLPFLNR